MAIPTNKYGYFLFFGKRKDVTFKKLKTLFVALISVVITLVTGRFMNVTLMLTSMKSAKETIKKLDGEF